LGSPRKHKPRRFPERTVNILNNTAAISRARKISVSLTRLVIGMVIVIVACWIGASLTVVVQTFLPAIPPSSLSLLLMRSWSCLRGLRVLDRVPGLSSSRERVRCGIGCGVVLGGLLLVRWGILAFAGVYHVRARILESVAACPCRALVARLPGEIISRHPVPHCEEVLAAVGAGATALSLRIAAPGQSHAGLVSSAAIASSRVLWPRLHAYEKALVRHRPAHRVELNPGRHLRVTSRFDDQGILHSDLSGPTGSPAANRSRGIRVAVAPLPDGSTACAFEPSRKDACSPLWKRRKTQARRWRPRPTDDRLRLADGLSPASPRKRLTE